MENFDVSSIESIGTACSEINLEAAAAVHPDLFVFMNWGEEEGAAFCASDEQFSLLTEIAPVIQISAEGESSAILQRYLDLAGAFGADLESTERSAKRERHEAASARLQAAIKSRPEITVLPLSMRPDRVAIAEPGGYGDLSTLQQEPFSMDFAGPFPDEFTETWWEKLSPETVDKYRGDVILMDARRPVTHEERLDAYPLWAILPEVEDRQIVEWYVPGSFNYTRDAEFMEALAEAIETAEDHVSEAS